MASQPPKPYHEERPWGEFTKFVENSPCTVKIITLNKGQSFSLQYHNHRDEFWRILSGNGIATIGIEVGADKSTQANEISVGKEFFVPSGTLHRIEAGDLGVTLLEITYGQFDENDIVRTEDRYGRVQ